MMINIKSLTNKVIGHRLASNHSQIKNNMINIFYQDFPFIETSKKIKHLLNLSHKKKSTEQRNMMALELNCT
jgi:hypothetical protein